MSEETYTFDQARARLEEIAKQAKGAGLEQCLDLLEEGVQLANVCTERIDHTRWRDEVEETEGGSQEDPQEASEVEEAPEADAQGASEDDAPEQAEDDADEDETPGNEE